MSSTLVSESPLSFFANRMMLERPLEALVRQLAPTWSRTETRAEVIDLRRESPRATTVVLAPNGRWRGFEPGQFVPVTFEVNGVRTTRCYSLSEAPERGRLQITVARHPQGKVSRHVHDSLALGAVVTLGEAAGELVLPREPGPVLLIAAGSGVTPMRAHVRALAKRHALADVILVQDARTDEDLLFAREFRALAEVEPGFTYVPHTTAGDDPARRIDGDRLATLVPDFAARTALACGPGGLVAMVEATFAKAGARERLRTESFTPPPSQAPREPRAEAAIDAPVALLRSHVHFNADGRTSLLVQAEAAGARPKSGCRMGICHTCTCTKRSGTTVNLLTGRVSSEPNEAVQLCVSAALGPVELDV
jgi:ferredoxin-NADP reductase